MATFKFVLFSGSKRADNSYPVSLRITKDRKVKFISKDIYISKSME